MPVLPPSTNIIIQGPAYTVGSCISSLPDKYGNRQNFGFNIPGQTNYTNQNFADGSLAQRAVTEAIKELTETYEFEELKYQTQVPPNPTLALTTGNGLVPIATILETIPINTVYPQFQAQNFLDITDVYTFWIWFSGGPNQAGRTLKYRRITTIDQYSYGITSNQQGSLGVAPPVYYSRFGGILQVGPYPDNNYQFFVRVKLRHPFPVPWAGVGPLTTAQLTAFVPATFTTTLTGNVVTAVTVVTGGAGYQPSVATIPLVFSSPPSPTLVTATGTANTNSSGQVISVNLGTGGTGYQTPPSCNTAVISGQPVYAPDSWQEIIEIAACQRIALWEGADDYIEMFTAQLKDKITALNLVRTADMVRAEKHNERQVSVRVAQYTSWR
jgi:hypothetical protein